MEKVVGYQLTKVKCGSISCFPFAKGALVHCIHQFSIKITCMLCVPLFFCFHFHSNPFLFPFCYKASLVQCIHQFSIKIPYICFLFLFFSTFTFTPFSVFYFHFHLTPFLCSLWLWLCTASINVTSRYHAVCLSSLCF